MKRERDEDAAARLILWDAISRCDSIIGAWLLFNAVAHLESHPSSEICPVPLVEILEELEKLHCRSDQRTADETGTGA